MCPGCCQASSVRNCCGHASMCVALCSCWSQVCGHSASNTPVPYTTRARGGKARVWFPAEVLGWFWVHAVLAATVPWWRLVQPNCPGCGQGERLRRHAYVLRGMYQHQSGFGCLASGGPVSPLSLLWRNRNTSQHLLACYLPHLAASKACASPANARAFVAAPIASCVCVACLEC